MSRSLQPPGKDPLTHSDIEKYSLSKRTTYLNTHASSRNRIVRLLGSVRLLIANFHKAPTTVLKTLDVVRFGKKALSFEVIRAITPFLDRNPYDIVHCQFGTFGNLGLILKDTGILRGKLVTSFRGYDIISSYTQRHGEHISVIFFPAAISFSVSATI